MPADWAVIRVPQPDWHTTEPTPPRTKVHTSRWRWLAHLWAWWHQWTDPSADLHVIHARNIDL